MKKSDETRKYAAFHRGRGLPESAFRPLGRTGWTVSAVGFGTYRVGETNPDQAQALRDALQAGCNLIDTSTNYTDGSSEKTIGMVLRTQEGKLPGGRAGVVLVSKVGYVQGSNLELVQAREQAGTPFPDMVKYSPDCWHCMSPEFIDTQLTLSLNRLEAPSLDVYLLHNPEYFFSDADHRKSKTPLPERREEFYRRVEAAFRHLEKEVERGRILHYGVSSNSFGAPEEDTEFTSVSTMWKIAEKISPAHHFSVVQLPANLLESGPFLSRNNEGLSAVEFCRRQSLAVLVNRPLNALSENRLFRLAELPSPESPVAVGDCLHEVAELEEEFVSTLGRTLRFKTAEHSAKDLFRWSLDLVPERTENLSPDQWSYLESQVILPQTHDLLEQLAPAFAEAQRASWQDWQRRYLTALGKLLTAIRFRTTEPSRKMGRAIQEKLAPHLSAEARKLTFSQQAIATLAFTPGVTCVLNGMRRPAYVEDSLAVLKLAPWDVTPEWYEDLK